MMLIFFYCADTFAAHDILLVTASCYNTNQVFCTTVNLEFEILLNEENVDVST